MVFRPNTGVLSGLNDIISQSLETKFLKFRDPTIFQLTGSQIFQSGRDIVIENGNLPGNFKLKHKSSDGFERILHINEFMNMSGIRDITMNGTFRINNVIEHKIENILGSSNSVIDNKNNGSGIEIRCYDNGAVMRKITINPLMNMSGINDLYVQRIFFNNTLFNPNDVNILITKNTQISYLGSPEQTRITKQSTGKGILIAPDAQGGIYNHIVQTDDSVIAFLGSSSGSNGALTLTNWSGTKSGIRIKSNETEAYNLKILDGGLKFEDNTVQTTAMTNAYLTTLIQNVVSQMTITIPVGTILAYGNGITPPLGYYWCGGGLLDIDSDMNLFNVIGHNFSSGKFVPAGTFYLPDFRGAYLKGVGTGNALFSRTVAISNVGEIQQGNVGHHKHTYRDRGINNVDIGAGSFRKAANDSNGLYTTSGITYDPDTEAELQSENRPNSVGIMYIIKY